jgi:hypothetical protein
MGGAKRAPILAMTRDKRVGEKSMKPWLIEFLIIKDKRIRR